MNTLNWILIGISYVVFALTISKLIGDRLKSKRQEVVHNEIVVVATHAIRINPGDILFLQIQQVLTEEQFVGITKVVQEKLPNNKVVLIDGFSDKVIPFVVPAPSVSQ